MISFEIIWIVGYIFELSALSLNTKIFWDNIQFIGSTGVIFGLFIFTLSYVGVNWRKYSNIVYGSAFFHILIIFGAFFFPTTDLIRVNSRVVDSPPFTALLYEYGILTWIYAINSYIIIIINVD